MANDDRRRQSRPVFRDEAERGGQSLGGGVGTRYGGAVGRRSKSGTDYRSGYSGYENLSGSFVDDYRGGPGSGASLPVRPRHGSGLGAFGYDDDARQQGISKRGKGPKNYTRSDERIREDLHARLTDDPHLDASDIEISVSNGEVTLSGQVRRREDKRYSEDLAESVLGVRHVQNNLRVEEASRRLHGGLDTVSATGAGGGATDTLGPVGGMAGRTKSRSRVDGT